MTGFGQGSAALGTARLSVEVRTVNGRFLDLRVRMPDELLELASLVETGVRKRLARGRCDVAVRIEGDDAKAPAIDKARARAAYRDLVALRDELNPGADVPFSMLANLPNLFAQKSEHAASVAGPALESALGMALDSLETMRRQEGAALRVDLSSRLHTLKQCLATLAERAPMAESTQLARFRERFARVWGATNEALGADRRPDEARLEQELLALVERANIAEELTRLRSHSEQLESYLEDERPLGRRLDFLLQEMAREINTIGAKAQDFAIAHAVVELKAEIERMREQVQNVE
jgi:uncharacterized protein (TIGR00255 family)